MFEGGVYQAKGALPGSLTNMIAAVFPGQGSQVPGMGSDFFAQSSLTSLLDELNEAAGRDLKALCLETDEATLRETQNAQLALFTCGVLAYRALEREAQVFAGHSIGEYAALVSAGVLAPADGVRLVKRRGELMATAGKDRPGTMAAVLGLDRSVLDEICASVTDGVAVVANDNCPGQLVISGDVAAVGIAGEKAKEEGAKRVLPLNVSGAFHSPLMAESARQMGEALRGVSFVSGGKVFSNVLAAPNSDPARWAELLEKQLENPGRWTESVLAMTSAGADVFVECGAGEVLCGLVRRTSPGVKTMKVSDNSSLTTARELLAQ